MTTAIRDQKVYADGVKSFAFSEELQAENKPNRNDSWKRVWSGVASTVLLAALRRMLTTKVNGSQPRRNFHILD